MASLGAEMTQSWMMKGRAIVYQENSLAMSHNADDIGSFSRFLIKELVSPPKGYNWQYLAFHSLWTASKAPRVSTTQVLLCFDVSKEMKQHILAGFQASTTESIERCPFAVYDALAGILISYYDKALWAFRIPIREIEKVRQMPFVPTILY
jgi:hypothetical protein